MNDRVRRGLDAYWRSFRSPVDEEFYRRARTLLENLRSEALAAESRHDLLLIASALTTLAAAVHDDEDVLRFSAEALDYGEESLGELTATILLRIQALHGLEHHGEELQLVVRLSGRSDVPNVDLVRYLEAGIRNHPGRIEWSEALRRRLQATLLTEPFDELAGRDAVPLHAAALDQFCLSLADHLRRWNERIASAFLSGER